jgi:hypothetical protein
MPFSFSDFQKFLWESDLDGTTSSSSNIPTHNEMAMQLLQLVTNLAIANRRIQLFIVPNDMYWPWNDEAQAHRQIFNAESNGNWTKDKSALVLPREPKMVKENPEEVSGDELVDDKPEALEPRGLFSVYNYGLVIEQIVQVQLAIEKSQEAALVNSNYEKIRDDSKMWAIVSSPQYRLWMF